MRGSSVIASTRRPRIPVGPAVASCGRRRRVAAAAVLLALFAAAAGYAATTSRLTGIVVDRDNKPVRGVTIRLSSDVLIGGPQAATTTDDGSFAFNLLPPGLYRVEAEKARYAEMVVAAAVMLDREARVEMQLFPVTYTDEVQVVATRPLLDRTRVQTGQSFDRVDLETVTIGSANRSYLAVLQQAPGVGGDRVNWCSLADGSGGNPRVAGSTFAENAYIVDGMGTTDSLSGSWMSDLPFDAIQEVSIQTAGFDAEYGNATGGVVNLVTRSGGNRFSGSFDFRYNDERFLTDGHHFDADTDTHAWRDLVLTLGGPVLRDRIWFFASYDFTLSGDTPSDSPTTRAGTAKYWLAKLTWQAGPAWRTTASSSHDPYEIDNENAAWYVAPEATEHWRQGGRIAAASVQGVLTARLLWQAQAGRQRSAVDLYPQGGSFSAIGRENWGEDLMFSGNAVDVQFSDRDRDAVATSLEWLSAGRAGSHDLKGGIELSRRMFDGALCSSGTATNAPCPAGEEGIHFEDFGEPPLAMIVQTGPGFLDDQGRQASIYLQDTWDLSGRLTLKLGLRWDRVDFHNAAGTEIAVLDKLQPRLGVVLDLTGDGKTLVRGMWGRFMHPSALFLPDFTQRWHQTEVWTSCTYLGVSEATCRGYADRIGGSWRTDPVGYDPAGWVLHPGDTYGSGANAVDPGLQAPYSEQLSVGVERQLVDRTAVELTYLRKKTRDIIEDTCIGNVPTPSEGADCSSFVALNLPGLRRDYQGVTLRVDSRVRDWLRVMGSYVYSTSKGNVESTELSDDFDLYPWHFENRYGYLSDDRRHRVKLNGYLLVPLDFTVAFSALWESPYRWQPYETGSRAGGYGVYYTEPRGSREGASYSQLDLQLSKGFRFGGARLELIASVFNVLSRESVIAVCEPASCSEHLGEAKGWQYPRWYEAGLRVSF
jgi:hypothetical protein